MLVFLGAHDSNVVVRRRRTVGYRMGPARTPPDRVKSRPPRKPRLTTSDPAESPCPLRCERADADTSGDEWVEDVAYALASGRCPAPAGRTFPRRAHCTL